MKVGVENGKIIEVKGMEGYPVNNGEICTLAANLPPIYTAKGRLERPMIRRNGELIPAGWEEAISYTATSLRGIIDKHGPNSVAFYGGAINLNEEYYLINKLMKAAIGTNNVECSTRLCMSSTALGLISTLGIDAPPACYADIEEADLFFIAGNNMAVTLPVLFNRINTAKRTNGAKVIVVDPRRTETASIADIHLQIWPGTDVALNNGIAHILISEGCVNEEKTNLYCSGFSDLKEHLDGYPPSRVASITGCPEEKIVEAAMAIGSAKAMLAFWFQGYNHSTQAVYKNNTLHNILLLTDNYCRPGAGPLPVNGEANTQGNRWVGTLSHLLPGARMISNPLHRQEMADFWDIPVEKIAPVPGRSIIEIIKGLHSGDVRALWVATTNPAVSLPNSRWIEEGLKKAEFLVVQDIYYPTETAEFADVVMAGAHWYEKTGTLISSERRVELVEKMVEPPGEAKGDYEIIWLVARAMGYEKEFPYNEPEEVFEEYRKITRNRICDMGGVTYERLRNEAVGPQLPCPEEGHPGTSRLFQDKFFPRPDRRAALLARDYIEPADRLSTEYPLVLITGRLAAHFNTRTRTGRVAFLNNAAQQNFIEINPEDAARMSIYNGDELEVVSRRGRARGTAKITGKILPGTIYMNMHYGRLLGTENDSMANLVSNQAYDAHSKQPEFKFSAVDIAKVSTVPMKKPPVKTPRTKDGTALSQETVRFFEELIRTSADGIIITDSTQNIIMANEAFCNIFERKIKDVRETSLFLWLEQLDTNAVRQWAELEREVYLKGFCHNVELQTIEAAGEERYFSINASRSTQELISDNGGIISFWRDITKRKIAEKALLEQKKALEQKNIALSEVLGQIELEKKQMENNVIANAESLLLPIIEKLKLAEGSREYAQLLQKNLEELTSTFGKKIMDKRARLTSREIEICNMIKNGLTSKEVAGLLNVSLRTVEKHRINIRNKLGIVHKEFNLSSYLRTL